ncbi:MAG: M56 family metallopeptidase [bacterium]
MSDWAHDFMMFLVLSSIQLIALGVIAAIVVAVTRVRGSAAYWIFALVLFLPFLLPLGRLLPQGAKIQLPLSSALVSLNANQLSEISPDQNGEILEQPTISPIPKSEIRIPNSSSIPHSEIRNPQSNLWVPHWKVFVLSIWLLAVAVLLFRLLWGIWGLRRTVGASKSVDDEDVLRLLQECTEKTGLRSTPRLAVAESFGIPIVTGFFRPVVVLPEHLLQVENRKGLRFTLLHELAHLRRRDSWWLLIEMAVKTFYFFHPVVHWVLHRIKEEREYLCDLHVVQITKSRSSYADFLLNEVWDTGNGKGRAFALPFGCKTPATTRRVHRILSNRRRNMIGKIRDGVAVGIVLLVLAPLLGLSAGQTQGEVLDYSFTGPDRGADSSEGVICHILPVIESLDEVKIVKKNGPYGEPFSKSLTADQDYVLIEDGRFIRVTVPIDPWNEQLVLIGKWSMPWTFRTLNSIESGSVRMLLGNHICQEGVDFEVEEDAGVIRVLKPELCGSANPIEVNYRIKGEAIIPQNAHTLFRGDRGMYGEPIAYTGDENVLHQFMGLPPGRSRPARDFTNMGASPTEDPRVFTLTSVVNSETMLVSIPNTDKTGARFLYLKEGVDYTYNQEEGLIYLVGDTAVGAHELWVQGTTHPNIFLLHRPLREGSITATLNGEELKEGEDFVVDYEKGKITVLASGMEDEDAEFKMRAGNWSFTRSNRPPEPGNRGFLDAEDYDPSVSLSGSVGTNALPTDEPMVYSLHRPYQLKGFVLGIGDRTKKAGDIRWMKRDRDYTYDEDTGFITFPGDQLPFNPDRGEYIFISAVPRQDLFWFHKALSPGDVQITLNGKELKEGEDFVVDYEKGSVKVLDPAIKDYRATYKVAGAGQEFIDRWTDRSKPSENTGKPSRDFADAEDYDPEVDLKKSVGMGPSPTDDPMVYTLSLKVQTKGLLVGVVNKDAVGVLKWLKRDRDYTHNEDEGIITLLKEGLFDSETERLFLSGIPNPRNVRLYHKQIEPGSVKVKLEGRELEEGVGFTVDYEKGVVTVTDPVMIEKRWPDCKIYVKGVDGSSGGTYDSSGTGTATKTGTE